MKGSLYLASNYKKAVPCFSFGIAVFCDRHAVLYQRERQQDPHDPHRFGDCTHKEYFK